MAVKIRVGILCNGTSVQRWQADAIRHVLDVPGVEFVVIVQSADRSDQQKTGKLLNYPFSSFLYRHYRKRWSHPAAMQPEDISNVIHNVPTLKCTPQRKGPVDQFDQEDLNAIAAYRPDVLLRFGFNILKGAILTLPKYGVWSFHHGDPTKYRGGPPALWEILNGEPVTGAVLQRLTEKLDAGYVLRQGWFQTIDHDHDETVDTVLGQSTIWPAQVLRELVVGKENAALGEEITELGKLYKYPRNIAFLRFLWVKMQNKLRFHKKDLHVHEEWNVGILPQPIQSLLEESHSSNVRWLTPPAMGTSRSDPFGYYGPQNGLNLIYQKFVYSTQHSEIARLRPKMDNVLKRSRTMHSSKNSVSYPYVVSNNGNNYIIPTSVAEGNVTLFRVNSVNDGLDRITTLLEEPVYDPTLFLHNDLWWLFGTKDPLPNIGLFAYWSYRLEGPYTAHILNPIKFDIRSARPGGTPFYHENKLYRPAKDSTTTYGARIALNHVLNLSPTTFIEKTVKYLEPFKNTIYNKGFHTLSAVGDQTLVDGMRIISKEDRKKAALLRKKQRMFNKHQE